MPFSDYQSRRYCFSGREVVVYLKGDGPPVIVVHETPNAHPGIFTFADYLVESGFQVWVPSLFGRVNEEFSSANVLRFLGRSCLWREFSVLRSHQSSPITEWLRGLGHLLHSQSGAAVGLVGMCITGNFALALCNEAWMKAPVLAQPSLPFAVTPKLAKGLHVSQQTLENAKSRSDLRILGLRFTEDLMCPASRFQELKKHFGRRFEAIEIDSAVGNAHNISSFAHSVLTLDRVIEANHPTQKALERCVEFLTERLN